MKHFKDQCLASTHLDSQGEKTAKHILEGFVESYRGKRQPLNQAHDLSKPTAGHIENFRLIEDKNNKDEWQLIGDVYCDPSKFEEVMGGFSISYLEVLKRAEGNADFIVYLPYPHYNDPEYLEALLSQDNLSVGKWVKKAADPTTIALLGVAAGIFLTPIWDDIYKTKIAPKIYDFFDKNDSELNSRGINTDLIQSVIIGDHKIQVILIPIRGKEKECFSVERLDGAMKAVHQFLSTEDNPSQYARIHMYFHSGNVGFKLHKTENTLGEVIVHA